MAYLRCVFFSLWLLVMVCPLTAYAQYVPRNERGDEAARRRSNIASGNVRVTVYNTGILGRNSSPDTYGFEWPINSGQNHVFMSPWIGGEVITTAGDTLHIVDVCQYRHSPSGESWSFEAVPEYQNPASNGIAISTDPATWPPFWPDKMDDPGDPGWPGAWNGLLGKNDFSFDEEMYFHMSDDGYDRYISQFQPDSTDVTRAGMGIVVSQRVLGSSNNAVSNALLFVNDIYNAGTTDINKTIISFWISLLQAGIHPNDEIMVDHSRNRIFYVENGPDNLAIAHAWLVVPHDSSGQPVNIGRLSIFPAGSLNFSANPDHYFWNNFMVPNTSNAGGGILEEGDIDLVVSSGYFPLAAGTSQRLVYAMVFGADSAEVAVRTDSLKAYLDNLQVTGLTRSSLPLPQSFRLEQNFPNPFNPTTVISYQLSVVSEVQLEVYNLLGQEIRKLVDARQSPGRYDVQWNGRDQFGREVSSGVYLYRLEAGGMTQTRKMILLR